VNDEQEIRAALTAACTQRGKQAEIAAAFEVHPSTVKRWIEGAEIPPPVRKLLRLYLFGEIPFGLVHTPADVATLLEFEPDEFRIIGLLANRAGQSPAAWIRSQILSYLAFYDALSTGTSAQLIARKQPAAASSPPPQQQPITLAPVAPLPENIMPLETAETHWIDLIGGIAAGSQITSDISPEPIRCAKPYAEDCYALRVFGQSMEPKIPDQSTIIVRHWHEKGFPRKGTIVVYSDGFGSTLKEFGYRKARPDEERDTMGNVPVLRSLNKSFPDVQTIEGGRIDAVFVEMI